MNNRLLVRLCFAFVVAGIAWYGRRTTATPSHATDPTVPSATTVPSVPSVSSVSHGEIGFRDRQHLHDHFQKHGPEFGGIAEAEYLMQAQSLRDRPAGDPVLESVRSDGVVTRFDRSSGAFLAFDRDLTIRTFFKPNDGERYYRRQLARAQSEP